MLGEVGDVFWSASPFSLSLLSDSPFQDGELVAKMYPHPDHGWPREKFPGPKGRDVVQDIRKWIWDIARAHEVNAENILEIRDTQFPDSCVTRLEHKDFQDDDEPAGEYFRRALRRVWEL